MLQNTLKPVQPHHKFHEIKPLQPNPKLFVPALNFAGKGKRILQPPLNVSHATKFSAYSLAMSINSREMICTVNLKE